MMIFGALIVLATIFFPKGLITPELLKNIQKNIKSRVLARMFPSQN
jgi:hypothetical protein